MPDKGIKLAVYGQAKTGKTQFGCTFPGPVLLIGTEDGTATVKSRKDVHFARIRSSEELLRINQKIANGWIYKSVVIDTAGGFQDILLKEVTGLSDIPLNRNWGIATQQQWGQITGQTKEHLARFFALAEDPSVALNVVVIAHERTFGSNNDPESPSAEVIAPVVGASLTPMAARWLDGAVDYLCQTFKRNEVVEFTEKVAGKEKVFHRKTGKIEYCLRTGPHQYFLTGFRLDGGRQPPEAIVNPTYEKVKAVIDNLESK